MSDFDLTYTQTGDLGNKIGGQEGAKGILSGELVVVKRSEANRRWIKIDENTIAVDLESSPGLPFAGAQVEKHIGVGGAIFQKQADGLYRNGRKVGLHLSGRQKGGKVVKGYELRDELTGKPVLNANELDALYDNPHLLPEEWKRDENGNIRFIFFWGTIYRNSDGGLYVRYIYFDGGSWDRVFSWLDRGWRGNDPAALAS
ncbi:MAG: hypothetical protein HYT67_00050 [Candidatus Yanofskybacteria bacterium]|nr:hypothetical protein [Candidatus Yanofskybacteria bacterium]